MSKFGALAVLLLVCLISWSWFNSPGTGDVNYWKQWIANAEELGLVAGYQTNQDFYPPLSTVILYGVSRVSRLLDMTTVSGFKLSLFVFLLLATLALWLWTRNLMITSLLHLSLTLNVMGLGYIDIYIAPTLILALWALQRGRWFSFSLLFTVTCLVKWQPVILVPFIIAFLLRQTRVGSSKGAGWKQFAVKVVLPSLLIAAAVIAVFGFEMVRTLGRANADERLSGNALNLNWVLSYYYHVSSPERFGPLVDGRSDWISTKQVRIVPLLKLAFVITYATVLFAFLRRENSFRNLLLFSLTGYLAYFILNTGVHENHLFVACILGFLLYSVDPALVGVAAAVALAANLNLLIFYGIDGRGLPFDRVVGVDMALVLSIVYVLLFGLWFYAVVKGRLASELESTERATPGASHPC